MIHVLAVIEVVPGRRQEFLAEMARVLPQVRAEAGCLEYGPAVDRDAGLANAAPLRPDVVVMIEKWTDAEALRAHLAAAHMKEYRARVKGLVARVELRVLEPA